VQHREDAEAGTLVDDVVEALGRMTLRLRLRL
jgi:hypothetical protein